MMDNAVGFATLTSEERAMDAAPFAALARSLTAAATRRGTTRALAGLGLVGALGSLFGLLDSEAKKKRKKKKKCKGTKCGKKCLPKSACCTDANCENDGETCVNNACACPDGQDACGGSCLDSCPASRVRNPKSCGCCRPANVEEQVCDPIHDVCCAEELPCHPISGDGPTVCDGRPIGQPCSFDEQCDSGFCNPNLVCA